MNLVVQDLRCDHNLVRQQIHPPPTGLIPTRYVDQWGVIHEPNHQPILQIHNLPIHYYCMDHISKRAL